MSRSQRPHVASKRGGRSGGSRARGPAIPRSPRVGRTDEIADSMAKVGVEALLVPSFPRFFKDVREIIDLAARRRIPAVYEWPSMAKDGGLMAYGPTFAELDGRVAAFVDRILKGAKAGDQPIEQPTKFELVINLKTAKALGLTIPQSLLRRADEIIQ